MRTTIDRGGRLVIPKAIRELAGLTPGMEVEVRFNDGNVEIQPPRSQGKLVEKDGLLVWDPGPGAPPIDVRAEIERLREERMREILGEEIA
jgi:AbrB family looped-hinge helix DNA binding protein